MEDCFSVCEFYSDSRYKYVKTNVSLEEALAWANSVPESLPGRIGQVKRVTVTDFYDKTVFEWCYGEGVTFPKT